MSATTMIDTQPEDARRTAGGDPKQMTASVEVLAYLALAAVAAALRLAAADWMPLDQAEAALSLPAWLAAQPLPVDRLPGAPLLFHLQRLLFWLHPGGGEATARFAPALAGAAAVPLAAGLRPVLGRSGALAAAGLLAIGPLWVFLGRHVSPATLTVLVVVLLLGGLARRGRRDALLVPAAAALLLTTGPGGMTFVLGAGLYLALGAVGFGRHEDGLVDWLGALWPGREERRQALVVFALTLVLAATGLLTRPDGFASVLETPALWAARLSAFGAGMGDGLVMPLLVYAPLTVVFGLVGQWLLSSRRDPWAGLLVAWTLVALITAALSASPAAVPELLLPLTLTAGLALGRLAERVANRFTWSEEGVMAGILLAVLSFSLVQAFRYASALDAVSGSNLWQLMMGGLAMAVLLGVVYALLWGVRVAGTVLGITAALALLILGWAGGARLGFGTATDLREPMRPRYVAPTTGSLVETLAAASLARSGDRNALPAVVDPAMAEVLAWPLRERRDLRWGGLDGRVEEEAAVRAAGEVGTVGDGNFVGRTWDVAGTWQPGFADRHALVRWWLQRRSAGTGVGQGADNPPRFERADLYLKVK